MPAEPNYYEILEVSRNASTSEIKAAYRRKVRQCHPDLHAGNDASYENLVEQFRLLTEVYRTLTDTDRRSRYDRDIMPATLGKQSEAAGLHRTGLQKAKRGDHRGAIQDYDRALEKDRNYADAYKSRGESHYKMGNSAEALKDYNQALQLQPELEELYYHRGLARFRLGYIQAAIEDYTLSIQRDPNRGQAYYRRGLAYIDLGNKSMAVSDLREAAQIFRSLGDLSGYQIAQDSLRPILGGVTHGQLVTRWFDELNDFPVDVWRAVKTFSLNPAGGLLPAYASLDRQRAVQVGIGLGLLFAICFAVGANSLWGQLGDPEQNALIKHLMIGILLYGEMVGACFASRKLLRGFGNFAGDLFVTGAALFPMGILVLIAGFLGTTNAIAILILGIFAFSYAAIALFVGSNQIANLSEGMACLATSSILAIAGATLWGLVLSI